MRCISRLIFLAIIAVLACGNWTHGFQCDVSKNSNSNFGAVGSGLVDDSAAFTGTGSFLDFAINAYQPSNPGKEICLAENNGNRYFFGSVAGQVFDGVTNLALNANGATMTNALNLSALSGGSGQAVLTFASIPAGITTGMPVIDDTNTAVLDGTLTVLSINSGAHQVTLSGNISAPGVTAGDVISFKGGGFLLGTKGMTGDSAMVATVVSGATSVTLNTPSQTSKFVANTWALMAGLDQQGFGSPMNMWVHEYVFITAINGVTGQITFQSPLKLSYESTWPGAGAAALYVMPASWNVTQVYNNPTIIGWDGPGNTLINNDGRMITYNNPSFPGQFGPNISQNQTIIINNASMPNIARLEVDKLWEVASFNGGTINGFNFFSATANDTLTLSGAHVTQSVIGSPGTFNIVNSTLDGGLRPGAIANGVTSSVSCSNSNLGTPGIFAFGGIGDGLITTANGVTLNTSGLMTVPRSLEAPVPWAVPGADMFFGNSAPATFGIPFSVVDVTGDATNTYVQTNLTGHASLPGSPVQAAAAKTINFVGCTGSASAVDLSQAPARNARPFTYSNRIYTCTSNLAAVQAANPGVPVININSPPTTGPIITRALQTLTVAVSTADTGTNPTVNLNPTGQFFYPTTDATGAVNSFVPTINLKTVGTRIYNGTTAAWTGSHIGDTLPTIPVPSYMPGVPVPFLNVDLTGESAGQCPVVTVTWQTSYLLPAANDNVSRLERVA